jgi:alpha-glucosidase
VPETHDPDAAWHRHAVIYQVYPRSWADGDGDGVGDLPGITGRLEHLVDLGVDAVWLSPFYPSPQADAGYDVSDHCDVDPLFGSLADAEALLERAHALGLRVIVDLVPNHTSDAHPWFRAALAAPPGSPERDRFVFRDGRGADGGLPPNNWSSAFGGPAWTRVPDPDGRPGQWYLHLFDARQPDLSWDNHEVREHFEQVLRFWLDRGVDGFRVDVAAGLVKDPALPDWHGSLRVQGLDAHGRPHPARDQEGVHEIYRAWRRLLEEYDGGRVLVAEAWLTDLDRAARYVRPDEMHQAFNFAFLLTPWRASELAATIDASLRANDAVGAPTTWVLSNHDVVRHASRFGTPARGGRMSGIGADDPQPDEALGLRRARAATLLMLALPGSAYLYQGEELGLPDHTTLPDEARQDPTFARTSGAEKGRDGCRVPIPWQADAPAYGFSPTGRSWLPQPAHWARYAADAQRDLPGSTFELYRAALRLRRRHRLGTGALTWVDAPADVLAFANGDLRVVANLGARPVPLPAGARVLLASAELTEPGLLPPDTTAWLAPDLSERGEARAW